MTVLLYEAAKGESQETRRKALKKYSIRVKYECWLMSVRAPSYQGTEFLVLINVKIIKIRISLTPLQVILRNFRSRS